MMNHKYVRAPYAHGLNYGGYTGLQRLERKGYDHGFATRADFGQPSQNGNACPLNRNRRAGHSMPFGDSTRSSERFGRGGICGCGRSSHGNQTVPAQSVDIPSIEEGCGCGCGEQNGTNCDKLLKQIQTVDFALYEVILYLDAYPDHCEALELYHKLVARRKGLWASYEEACGPLTAMGNVSTTSWDWVKSPAPWEYSQN